MCTVDAPPPLPGQEVFVFQTPAGTVSRDCLHSVLTRFFQRDSFTRFLSSFVMILTYLDSLFIRESIFENDFDIAVNIRVYKNVFHVIFKLFLSPFKETVYQIFNPFSWFKLIWIHGLRHLMLISQCQWWMMPRSCVWHRGESGKKVYKGKLLHILYWN